VSSSTAWQASVAKSVIDYFSPPTTALKAVARFDFSIIFQTVREGNPFRFVSNKAGRNASIKKLN
jgi:hypothetical protein